MLLKIEDRLRGDKNDAIYPERVNFKISRVESVVKSTLGTIENYDSRVVINIKLFKIEFRIINYDHRVFIRLAVKTIELKYQRLPKKFSQNVAL